MSVPPDAASTTSALVFLGDGGVMGRLTRAYDWSRSPVGPPETWPQSLKTAIRLMLTSRHPMFIWWGPELTQFYNDAYAETMGPERHPSALGGRGRECWAEIWPIIGPQIEMVMRGEGSTWHEDQLVAVTRNGRREQVWWTYGYSPIDEQGEVGGVLVVCKDVTREHETREALARVNAELRSRAEQLQDLFRQAPGFIAALRGPDHVFEFANEAYLQLVGAREIVGKRVVDVLPEVGEQVFVELLDHVYATGQPHVGQAQPLRLRRQGGQNLLYVDFVYQPVIDSEGLVRGIFVEGHDVTRRVLAEERQRLLSHELQHRVKNNLSVVRALASLTASGAADVPSFLDRFDGRLTALGRTNQALIATAWTGAQLGEVLGKELGAFEDRVTLDGPDVMLDANQASALGLVVHELATNALKHGALSSRKGSVSVRWTKGRDQRGFSLVWEERDGPEVVPPGQEGFGAGLIKGLVGSDLAGEVMFDYRRAGLVCRIDW